MARKSSKSNETNTMDAINQAINTPINLQFCEVCEELSISDPQLRERLEAKTGDANVHIMDSIPCEWEPHIKSIRIDLDAERSTRKLEAQVEAPQLPEMSEQPIEQKPKRQRRSSVLTKKKEESIANTRQASTQTNKGVADALTLLQAQSGVQDGASAATAYLAGYNASLVNTKAQGLTVIAAETLKEISEKRNFDPNEVLQQIGVPLSSETLDAVNAAMGEILGKSQAATAEISESGWGNGVNWQDELTNLTNLMNLND